MIEATRAFVKDIPHFQEKHQVVAKAWVLINDHNKTRVYVNTYDGDPGVKFKPIPLPLTDKCTLGYKEVPVSECQVAVQV